jgi:recombination associated protein RdgC
MPVLSGVVTFARFRVEPTGARSDPKRWLLRGLARKAFESLEARKAEADRSAGFVELEDHDAVSFAAGAVFQGGHALFSWRVDTLRVPASAVKAELDRWAAAFASEQGRPPTKREKAQRKDEVRQLLRQRATPTSRTFDVSWNMASGEVAVWAASRKVVEEVAAELEEAFTVKLAPASASAGAVRAGIPEEALAPTLALFGDFGGRKEVAPGKA